MVAEPVVLFVRRFFCTLLTAPSLRGHINDDATSALVCAERTVRSVPRTSL